MFEVNLIFGVIIVYFKSFLYFFCNEDEIEFLGEFILESCGIELDFMLEVIL